jgi:hypothetical protein
VCKRLRTRKRSEGYLGKTVQQSVVGWWDVSSVAHAGARKEASEKVREAVGGSAEGVKSDMNGEVDGRRT